MTILFADLVGFTPFAAERDAEDVRAMLTRYFDLASDVITRYGGTVEKFIGDAVMAVWGAPTARENDAELAVRAALDLVDAVRGLGPGIQARAGVLTGEAAVTIGAVNQGMVAGDIVNTAARLQSVAVPGTVLVGDSTMRAASRAIAFESVGGQELKGKEAPVAAHRALRVVADVGGRNRHEGLEAPFVGRDDEMRTLKDQFHATARDQRTRLVSVIGPAGIGKSRLATELGKYVDGLVAGTWWHQGRSPAYGQGVTFWALGEMVRGRCHLVEGADEPTTRAAVSATLAAHVPDASERAWIEPALLSLLGIGDRSTNPEQLFGAWRTFFERLAATDPVVLIFEDLHWADAGTLDFIDHVLDWTRDLPILIVTLARPELLDRRPSWGAGKRIFLSLFLDPLPEPAMRALLAGLVPGLPERAVASIVGRADGVPLYAVETVRTLLADGRLVDRDGRYEPVGDLSELAVPETLTALIAARLDALDPVDRSLLQDAAVLGRSFGVPALVAVSNLGGEDIEPRLRAMARRELLSLDTDPRSPERGQYAFVQALIREVAYNTLARPDRCAKHLAAARWFESQGSDELAGALARHYFAAWQNSPDGAEADALAGQARLALTAAANRALALYANVQAIDLLREALEVTADPHDRAQTLITMATTSRRIGQYAEAERQAREAIRILRPLGDLPGVARAACVLARSIGNQMRYEESEELLREFADVLAVTDESNALELRVRLSVLMWSNLAHDAAERILEPALVGAERLGDRVLVLTALNQLGLIVADRGRVMQALALFEGTSRQADAIGLPELANVARGNMAVWMIDSDPAGALAVYRHSTEYLRRTGDLRMLIMSTMNAAEISVGAGEWGGPLDEARALLRDDLAANDWLSLAEQGTIVELLRGDPAGHERIAEGRARAGDVAALVDTLDDCLGHEAWVAGDAPTAIARWRHYATWSPLNLTVALPRSARAALWVGDVANAREDLARMVAAGMHGVMVDAHLATMRAGIAALEGRIADARSAYRDAQGRWRALRMDWLEALTCLDLVLLLGADDPDAEAAATRAREIMERLGARPFLAKLDAAFPVRA
ncbi:MAG: adenylate/guanylate cyclase domain-containing protein [Chloroflexota bacterium]